MILAEGPSWNPIIDLQQMWSFPFMVNAFRAGTIVAVLAGAMGAFMVLRRQSFAGHTLSLIGFPGAAGAVLVGVAASYGYFAFCLIGALVIAALPRAGPGGYSEESAVTGTVQSFALACGFLFVALYKGFLNGINALLFGNFLGITTEQVALLGVVAAISLTVLGMIGRPLAFASIDPDVARARNVPVRALSVAFLMLLGAATAEASQITGTLLVFALLVMPAATAQALTARPVRALALTIAIGLLVTWLGLSVAYYTPFPVGFFITSFAFAGYVGAQAVRHAPSRWRAGGTPATPTPPGTAP
ncbi:MAG: metal ABC transporter permease [Pseudonocardiales bacterium]|nr:metal ABC transporter permease [Pseudonocardiales bacterium]MBV9728779.1 metal ABC transporter permease [Pseudonocardiales bacterium]